MFLQIHDFVNSQTMKIIVYYIFFFSVFESWYIRQHRDVAKLPLEWMEKTFATTTFANGFLAIIAGVVANVLADNLGHGPRVLSFS